MIAGIVLLLLAGMTGPGKMESKTECTYLNGCQTTQEFVPNPFYSIFLWVGGFLFSGGWGGWVGAYDAERRMKRYIAPPITDAPPEDPGDGPDPDSFTIFEPEPDSDNE